MTAISKALLKATKRAAKHQSDPMPIKDKPNLNGAPYNN